MAVKKKNAAKLIPEKEFRALAQARMEEFKADAEARYKKAKAHYNKQSDDTQDSIDRMVKTLVRVAHAKMWVSVGTSQRLVLLIPEMTIYHNMFYMACEILKDLAVFDIRVADYTFPTDTCASCGEPVLSKKAKKKAKK